MKTKLIFLITALVISVFHHAVYSQITPPPPITSSNVTSTSNFIHSWTPGVLTADPGQAQYQWFVKDSPNGQYVPVPNNGNGQNYTPTGPGTYMCQTTNVSGNVANSFPFLMQKSFIAKPFGSNILAWVAAGSPAAGVAGTTASTAASTAVPAAAGWGGLGAIGIGALGVIGGLFIVNYVLCNTL